MLNSGTKLGPYEIVAPIGAGGMGEVYRARDTKLGRDVALKVLPEGVARDAERLARFRREAQVLASLNHPNIAAIYGFEDSGATHALVMELVEGPTLAERISGRRSESNSSGTRADLKAVTTQIRTSAIAIDEALPIAKQIAEGLEYAHERGIVHRDLKPANIKIAQSDAVKILDFGLAKALEGDASAVDISSSPTISRMATQAGIILGTAAYMSPEQAKGKSVDRRTDIWAFGCVLFEMLAGKMAFSGETVTDTLAAVIKSEPDWNALPAATPARIRELLQRCLKKDPRQRLQSIGDARVTLDESLANPDNAVVGAILGSPGAGHAPPLQNMWRRALPWAAAVALAIIAAFFAVGYFLRAPHEMSVIVSQILPPPNASFASGGAAEGPPVISPDGTKLVFVAVGSDSKRQLWVRPLNNATAQPLAGTDDARFPFWSPDGRSIAFFADGKLKRIDATGGPALALADTTNGRGGAWSSDGTILFAPAALAPLYRMPASGGSPQPATKLNASRRETTHRWPQFLPDGKHFLFYAHGSDAQNSDGTYTASLDGGEPVLLVRGDSNAVYANPGYLLFIRQGTLMAQQFDAGKLQLIGDAMPLVEHAEENSVVWRGIFSVSTNGILAFRAGGSAVGNVELLWFDRSGKQLAATGAPGDYSLPELSPDGRELAVRIVAAGTSYSNIWTYDLARGTKTRLTFASANDSAPAWSPDGKTIAFASDRGVQPNLYQKAADGTGSTSPLVVDDAREAYPDWSSDGRYVVYERQSSQPGSHFEIWAVPLFGDRKPFPVVQNQQFNDLQPALSPDGKWLGYVSDESGRPEIYVVPFLHGSGKWQVSTGGGNSLRWRRDGKELFYLSLDNKVMGVGISEQGASLALGKVTPLFQVNSVIARGRNFDVTANGQKFVVVSSASPQAAPPLTLVTNWPALLKKQ